MNPKLNELGEKLTALRSEITDFVAIEDPTAEQGERYDAALAEWDTAKPEYDAEHERVEAYLTSIERVESAVISGKVESGSGAKAPEVLIRAERNLYDFDQARAVSASPAAFEDELRSRAESAIEEAPRVLDDTGRGSATALLERHEGSGIGRYLARHILHTGSPAYRGAFYDALSGDVVAQSECRKRNREMFGELGTDLTPAERAAMTVGTNSAGGFLMPFELDTTIILSNAGVQDQIRGAARVEQITTNVWHGVSSAGVSAEWVSESAESTDASPTFAQPTVTAYRADAYLQASFEATQDTDIAANVQLLVSDAKARLEAAAFATGSGSGQPFGVVTVLQGVTASRVTAATNGAFGAVDVYALDNSLSPRWRDNAKWLANKSVFNLVRQFGGSNATTFWADLGHGQPPQLIGYDALKSSTMFNAPLSTATASNDDVLALVDFSQYLIADRIGMSVAYNPLVIGANRRPTGEVGWFAFWRTGANLLVNDAGRLLRV